MTGMYSHAEMSQEGRWCEGGWVRVVRMGAKEVQKNEAECSERQLEAGRGDSVRNENATIQIDMGES